MSTLTEMFTDGKWTDIPEYEGLYYINESGEIFSIKSNSLLKQQLKIMDI